MDSLSAPLFALLKTLSYVALAAMAAAMIYAGVMSLLHWSAIAV